ncbi:hypothetical protein DLJ47_18165 [Micromonospora sp. S4605]|uniref:hypothetical protein n=1 Tax=Micromonospora sp. S4605 TaxID=1420897 RepID=UPI000D6EBD2D|nr:hypothetical protein [Micromonospora sp. S4605]PWU52783.1 hypothetical protein DLJ47_18165 [Micromonospora sp. S4605]
MSEQDSSDAYTPPPPKLKGFGRGSSLTGLVGADRTSAVSALTTPPAHTRTADDTESEPVGGAVAGRAESTPAAAEEAPTPARTETVAAQTASSAAGVSTNRAQPANGLPDLSVDLDDPAALVVSPTVLSVPAPLMARFERARRSSTSNTELVLDALRAHLANLPRLVAEARRPAATAVGEPFPWRGSAQRRVATKVRRVQLPIRPLAGELQVIDTLVGWVQEQIGAGPRSLGGRVTRSEVVAAALNAHLPADRPRGRRPRS